MWSNIPPQLVVKFHCCLYLESLRNYPLGMTVKALGVGLNWKWKTYSESEWCCSMGWGPRMKSKEKSRAAPISIFRVRMQGDSLPHTPTTMTSCHNRLGSLKTMSQNNPFLPWVAALQVTWLQQHGEQLTQFSRVFLEERTGQALLGCLGDHF